MVDVRIGGIHFEEWPTNFGECFLIDRNGLRAWRGGDLRREETARPASHGAFDAPGYQAQKLPALSGTILASSPEQLQHMKDRVLGLLSDGGSDRMVVDDEFGSTWRDVRLVSSSTPEDLDDLSATYNLTFWAADPRRFGEVRTFTSGATAVNYGNFPASPELVITGPHPAGYTVTAGASAYTVTSPLASGSTDVIDMSTGWVRRNGVLLVGGVSRADTWTVPPGLPGVVHTLSGGSGSLTVRVTDTFI